MKKIGLTLLFIFLLGLFPLSASADGNLVVSDKVLIELPGKSSAYFFAKIENKGDSPVALDNGKLVGFDKDDQILVTDNYVSSSPSKLVLSPGEYAYIRESVYESALEKNDIKDFKLSLDSSSTGNEKAVLPLDEVVFQAGEKYNNFICVTFTNTTTEVLYGAYVSVALYGGNNKLIYSNGTSADNVGIHPGSTVTLKISVDQDLINYYEQNNISISSADGIVYIDKSLASKMIDTTSGTGQTTTSSNTEIRPEIKELLDSYETFMDRYISFMSSYDSSAPSATMLSDYATLMSDYVSFGEKVDALNTQELSNAEMNYYLEVTTRVNQKLLTAMG